MSRACRVCGFGQSHLINLALRSGQSVAAVRQCWPHLTTTMLKRHQRWCLGLTPQGEPDVDAVQRMSAPRQARD
jgi:hypothetical protein